MSSNNKINFFYICFLFLVVFSLTQGYYCKYTPSNVCNELFKNYWLENGFIENLQAIFVLVSIIILIKIKFNLKKINFVNLFIIIKIFALIYYLGEEISWGQHFFKWDSPVIFQEINNQKETNLHNISNLFDQLPRALVFFWCAFSIILIKFIKIKNKNNEDLFLLISPNKKLIYISLLLLVLSIPDIVVDIFNLHPGHYEKLVTGGTVDIPVAIFIDKLTFNFIRLSELQELIFSFYFLSYSIFVHQIRRKFFIN